MVEKNEETSGERHIIKGPTQEELKLRVIAEAGEFPLKYVLSYDLFYDRMRRILRIGGIPLESAIRDAFVVDDNRRITGVKPLPSENPSEE